MGWWAGSCAVAAAAGPCRREAANLPTQVAAAPAMSLVVVAVEGPEAAAGEPGRGGWVWGT